jgi:BlaI family penicillinase repressor
MASKRSYRLGDLQLRILKVLWTAGPCTVAEVQAKIDGKTLAYTTLATMLRKMEDRQLVSHREEGRRFVYQAAVSSEEVGRGMAGYLVDRLFAGSLADTVSHLLQTREVSRRELARLEQLIAEHKKRCS